MFLDTALTSSWGFVSALLFMTDPLLNDPFRAAVPECSGGCCGAAEGDGGGGGGRGGRLDDGTEGGLNAASDSE